MFASRRRAVVRFGLWSTAKTRMSSSSANTIGTRCGAPSGRTVASRATRARESASRASPPFTLLRFALELEQEGLVGLVAAVAAERPAGVDHTVARHEDRDRVAAQGVSRGPRAA